VERREELAGLMKGDGEGTQSLTACQGKEARVREIGGLFKYLASIDKELEWFVGPTVKEAV
jgi:hypothetical protein